jgi:hypothetical protein
MPRFKPCGLLLNVPLSVKNFPAILKNAPETNRTFVSGGVAGDAIREIGGAMTDVIGGITFSALGAFAVIDSGNTAVYGDNQGKFSVVIFRPSFVVPTGPENSVHTISSRFWRRVA